MRRFRDRVLQFQVISLQNILLLLSSQELDLITRLLIKRKEERLNRVQGEIKIVDDNIRRHRGEVKSEYGSDDLTENCKS
jgi:hypothetical protein